MRARVSAIFVCSRCSSTFRSDRSGRAAAAAGRSPSWLLHSYRSQCAGQPGRSEPKGDRTLACSSGWVPSCCCARRRCCCAASGRGAAALLDFHQAPWALASSSNRLLVQQRDSSTDGASAAAVRDGGLSGGGAGAVAAVPRPTQGPGGRRGWVLVGGSSGPGAAAFGLPRLAGCRRAAASGVSCVAPALVPSGQAAAPGGCEGTSLEGSPWRELGAGVTAVSAEAAVAAATVQPPGGGLVCTRLVRGAGSGWRSSPRVLSGRPTSALPRQRLRCPSWRKAGWHAPFGAVRFWGGAAARDGCCPGGRPRLSHGSGCAAPGGHGRVWCRVGGAAPKEACSATGFGVCCRSAAAAGGSISAAPTVLVCLMVLLALPQLWFSQVPPLANF